MLQHKQWVSFLFLTVSVSLFELVYFFPKNIVGLLIIFVCFCSLFVWKLNILPVGEKIRKGNFWFFLAPVVLFFANAVVFALFLQEKKYFHGMALMASFFVFVYMRYLYMYFRQPLFYDAESLRNVSFHLNTLSIFFLTTNVLASVILLNANLTYMVILYIVIVVILAWQTLWVANILLLKAWIYALVSSVVIVELFWVFRYLPLNYYAVSFFLTVMFHLILSLSMFSLMNNWDAKVVRKYVIIGVLMSLGVFSLAQWRW